MLGLCGSVLGVILVIPVLLRSVRLVWLVVGRLGMGRTELRTVRCSGLDRWGCGAGASLGREFGVPAAVGIGADCVSAHVVLGGGVGALADSGGSAAQFGPNSAGFRGDFGVQMFWNSGILDFRDFVAFWAELVSRGAAALSS
jgi:hypothetical protein